MDNDGVDQSPGCACRVVLDSATAASRNQARHLDLPTLRPVRKLAASSSVICCVTARFNLSRTLQLRFHASGDRADLDLAVEGRRALLAVPDGDPRRAVRGAALADALQSLCELTGRGEDFDGAITAGQGAAAGTPSGHRNRAAIFSNLSKSPQTRWAAFGGLSELEGGLRAARAAVNAFPPGHPRRPAALTNPWQRSPAAVRHHDPADIERGH